MNTQPVCYWRIKVEGLFGYAATLGGGHNANSAHVVQSVSQLNHDHTNVFRHGHGHLLEVFCLGLVTAGKNLTQFRNTIDNFGYRFAELIAEGLFVCFGVLNNIMQQCRHDRLRVHAHIRQNLRHRGWVSDVGVSGASGLPLMGLLGIGVSPCDQSQLVLA